ncbi:ubiquitin carboxyl-terminal hydrolase 20-like [Canna indica]|uniref:Ubiquitin carboxyl-terminal hydrolase 20-like n=1 Tax=Canna indica TaxID=4628 RepID=A0AAQ3KD29_9LILI|nr:ubiquitin carboxyl-terminal hydrolase 20-like [Canna indica]
MRPLSLVLEQGAALRNLGNTCFLNAVLQCLTHTVPFVQSIRKTDHSCPFPGENGDFCTFCALKEHINFCLFLSGCVVEPKFIADNLSKISPDFQLGHQEDAHEFLQSLLGSIHARCLAQNGEDWLPFPDEYSLIKQVFGGRLRSQLRCCDCGHLSDTFEPLLDLSLEVNNVGNIVDALESFTRLEKIDDSEIKLTCEGCKSQVSMEKQLKLDQPPEVLVLHLKRFKNDGSVSFKINNPVEYPLELDLNPCLCFPLDEVDSVSESYVLKQRAYVLFYVKHGSSCWFSKFMEEENTLNSADTSPTSVLNHVDTYSLSSDTEDNGSCLRRTPGRQGTTNLNNNAYPNLSTSKASPLVIEEEEHVEDPSNTDKVLSDPPVTQHTLEKAEADRLLPLIQVKSSGTKEARKPAPEQPVKDARMKDQVNRLVRSMPRSRRHGLLACIETQQKFSKKRSLDSSKTSGGKSSSNNHDRPWDKSARSSDRSRSPHCIRRGLFVNDS